MKGLILNVNNKMDITGGQEQQNDIYFATIIDGCTSLGAEYVSRASLKSNDCAAIGGKMNDLDPEMCDLDWCKAKSFVAGGLYLR